MRAGPFDPGDPSLDEAVRAAARAEQGKLSDHPSPDQLADYSLGLHVPEEEDLIQEHLTHCTECAEIVLGLMDSAEAPPVEGLARPDLEREWQELQGRLRPSPSPGEQRPRPRPVLLTWGLAASLLACAVLLLWGLRLRSDLVEARAPNAEVVLADLVPEGVVEQRGRGEAPRFQLPAAGRLVLLLNLGDLRTFPRYRIEVVGERGEILWETDEARPTEVGNFALDLPAEELAPGTYQVRLFGDGDHGETRLAIYRFELVAAPS